MRKNEKEREQDAYDQLVKDMRAALRATTRMVGYTPTKDVDRYERMKQEALVRYRSSLKGI